MTPSVAPYIPVNIADMYSQFMVRIVNDVDKGSNTSCLSQMAMETLQTNTQCL